ncbi:MAG: hypothetical protein HY518_00250 [Candidatus Aenigmarchaeota archaeon]|nr:hypothetical protein [Candidatus Aenigmarchaeota archaeon]
MPHYVFYVGSHDQKARGALGSLEALDMLRRGMTDFHELQDQPWNMTDGGHPYKAVYAATRPDDAPITVDEAREMAHYFGRHDAELKVYTLGELL